MPPLPATALIPPAWSSHHAAIPAAAANARVRLTRPGTPAWDETTQSMTLTPGEPWWEGHARIQQLQRGTTITTAGDEDRRREYLVAAARDCPAVPAGTPLLVLAADEDPSLTGRTLHVRDVMHGSYRWERDLICTLDLDRDGTAYRDGAATP